MDRRTRQQDYVLLNNYRLRLRPGAKLDRTVTLTAAVERFGTTCGYCGVALYLARDPTSHGRGDKATLDHVVPLTRGGDHTWENVVLCCDECNRTKSFRRPSTCPHCGGAL